MAKRTYRMTPARRAALKRAQEASARKRRGKGKGKLAAANRKITKSSTRRKMVYGAAIALSIANVAHQANNWRNARNRRGYW